MSSFNETLASWYGKHRRPLPWRETTDPYLIWLSEIILQQTRVDQGMRYYHAFASQFPTVHDLAAASEDAVLRTWQGLGYYSRARNLHATARVISHTLGGRFPDTYAGLLALKGIGPYTAAAIASFAFGKKHAVVDGNVMRVISRIYGITEPVDTTAGRTAIESVVNELIPEHRPDLFNQAIMEFGALMCVPQNPDCNRCPFSDRCVAREKKQVDVLPKKAGKTAVRDVWYSYFIIEERGHTYIRKRSHSGIWKGLHDFPCVEQEERPAGDAALNTFLTEYFGAKKPALTKRSEEIVHVLSHRRIHTVFYHLSTGVMWKNHPSEFFRIPLESLGNYGLPRLIDRYLNLS